MLNNMLYILFASAIIVIAIIEITNRKHSNKRKK